LTQNRIKKKKRLLNIFLKSAMRLLKKSWLFLTAQNRVILPVLTAVFIISIAVLPAISRAAIQPLTAEDFGVSFGAGTGLGSGDIRFLIANIIKTALGLLGIIAVAIVLSAGFLWLTSQGEQDKIEKAKKILLNAVIGLAIILAAYAITVFVFKQLLGAVNGPGAGGENNGNNGGFGNGGYLGGGILRDVYPEPGAKNMPMNVKIMVMFSVPMDPETVINTNDKTLCPNPAPEGDWWCGTLAVRGGVSGVKILKLSGAAAGQGEVIPAGKVAIMTKDKKNFVIVPQDGLASDGDTRYSVNLTDNWRRASGEKAFIAGGYTWSFTVANYNDTTPPKVTSVFPVNNAQDVYRNAAVQANFSEPINVVSLAGKIEVVDGAIATTSPAQYFQVSYQDNNQIIYLSGEVIVSNGFKTAEFISDGVCSENGRPVRENSCGVRPSCLPEKRQLDVLLKAAQNGDIFSGITDVAGNSLVGNQENGDYQWSFKVGLEIDLTAPYLVKVEPAVDQDGVPVNSLVKANFSELILNSSLNNDNVRIFKDVCRGENFPEDINCYPLGGFTIYNQNLPLGPGGTNISQAVIKTYFPYLDPLTKYNPRFTTGVKDLYQNCLTPKLE